MGEQAGASSREYDAWLDQHVAVGERAAPPGSAVLVPVKRFTEAKLRLAPAVSPGERARLARAMATHVVSVTATLPVAVLCDDVEVARWASELGARVVWAPGMGLNRAVEHGIGSLAAAGMRRVIVAHADLPLAGDLGWVAAFAGITLVPDGRNDGTNVVCVPTHVGFRFAYGPGSFRAHTLEAERLRAPLRVVRQPQLGQDIDVPADLEGLIARA